MYRKCISGLGEQFPAAWRGRGKHQHIEIMAAAGPGLDGLIKLVKGVAP
jgi:hypothetical protein